MPKGQKLSTDTKQAIVALFKQHIQSGVLGSNAAVLTATAYNIKPDTVCRIFRELTGQSTKPIKNKQRISAVPTPPPVPLKRQVTEAIFALDASGSMRQHRAAAVRAFNSFTATIREQAKGQDVLVTLYTFGDEVKLIYVRQPISRLVDLNINDFQPDSHQTALFDTVGETYVRFNGSQSAADPNIAALLVVVTDGGENVPSHLRRYTDWQVRSWVEEAQRSDRWTIVFSCPPQYAQEIEKRLGVPKGNIQGWEQSLAGFSSMTQSQQTGLSSYFANRAVGTRSTRNFFAQVNIGRQTITEIEQGLEPVSLSRFRSLFVEKESKIKDFIETKRLKFELGRVFYPLTKKEKDVHFHKEILLQRKDDLEKLYGGTGVRDKLGIPHGQTATVEPGNLGEWNILIQSTSPNRSLVRGTTVLYDLNQVVSNTGHGVVTAK